VQLVDPVDQLHHQLVHALEALARLRAFLADVEDLALGSSRICATGRPCGLNAEVAISSLAATSFLSTERSRTISA
jgi:hypothetical protein